MACDDDYITANLNRHYAICLTHRRQRQTGEQWRVRPRPGGPTGGRGRGDRRRRPPPRPQPGRRALLAAHRDGRPASETAMVLLLAAARPLVLALDPADRFHDSRASLWSAVANRLSALDPDDVAANPVPFLVALLGRIRPYALRHPSEPAGPIAASDAELELLLDPQPRPRPRRARRGDRPPRPRRRPPGPRMERPDPLRRRPAATAAASTRAASPGTADASPNTSATSPDTPNHQSTETSHEHHHPRRPPPRRPGTPRHHRRCRHHVPPRRRRTDATGCGSTSKPGVSSRASPPASPKADRSASPASCATSPTRTRAGERRDHWYVAAVEISFLQDGPPRTDPGPTAADERDPEPAAAGGVSTC